MISLALFLISSNASDGPGDERDGCNEEWYDGGSNQPEGDEEYGYQKWRECDDPVDEPMVTKPV